MRPQEPQAKRQKTFEPMTQDEQAKQQYKLYKERVQKQLQVDDVRGEKKQQYKKNGDIIEITHGAYKGFRFEETVIEGDGHCGYHALQASIDSLNQAGSKIVPAGKPYIGKSPEGTTLTITHRKDQIKLRKELKKDRKTNQFYKEMWTEGCADEDLRHQLLKMCDEALEHQFKGKNKKNPEYFEYAGVKELRALAKRRKINLFVLDKSTNTMKHSFISLEQPDVWLHYTNIKSDRVCHYNLLIPIPLKGKYYQPIKQYMPPASSTDEWQCPQCTFNNKVNSKKCSMCLQDKPTQLVPEDKPTQLVPKTVPIANKEQDEWSCKICTFANHRDVKRCEMCEEQRE